MSLPERREQERLRRSFRPQAVKLLFIGESPPASGRFFYQGDSGLYRAMEEAFRVADPSLRSEEFLSRFQASGCYLIDLCSDPVDHLEPKPRRTACLSGEGSLARSIAKLQPVMIATVVRSIEGNVKRAASRAQWRGTFLHLPYPGRWHRHRSAFIEELAPVLVHYNNDVRSCQGLSCDVATAG